MDSLPKPPAGYRWKIKPVGWGTRNFYLIKLTRFGVTRDSENFLGEDIIWGQWVASEECFRKNAARAATKILNRYGKSFDGKSFDYLCAEMIDEQRKGEL
ncbi:hypothetical protein [Mycobacteroides immunogenum]|uniref:hypothetical protein n=1 Tax=Mycobacteroides immunogenum TaxID=83262 RepID=UPI000B296EB7|nr:hypothetical protein [Mycobacteroides immunogenum]